MSATDERNVNPVMEMDRIAQSILGLTSLEFKESYRSTKPGRLIYDSEWCRINLIWGGWDYRGGNSMHIRYGRLHAPSEKTTILWKGEECNCWHDIDYALHFLDGHTPTEAVNLNYSHPVTRHFYDEEFRKKYWHRQPEWLAEMHAQIWRSYNNRFFELFDLRRPDIWEQYQRFLKEIYDIEGRIPEIEPSLDKVC